MAICPSCGTENPEVARFCMRCGSALPGAAAEAGREARKTVTVVFADIVGSTALGEHNDPETVRALMGRWFDAMREVLERHGGTVEKFIGDAVVAVFGVPLVHEDDALRASRATVDMRRALSELNDELRATRGLELAMRVGVNTGPVVVGDARAGGSRATGDTVNVAARLQTAAEPGETLVGDATWRLVRDAVETGAPREISVKNRAEPVVVRALLAVKEDAEAIQRRVDGPMVGRARELDVLRSAFERALIGERTVMVTVLGTAGVGKSRLVHEFLLGVGDRATVVSGRCLPYGQGITWNPVVDLLRAALGLDQEATGAAVAAAIRRRMAGSPDVDAILSRLSEPLGTPGTSWPVEEITWAMRRLVEWLASDGPLIVVMDDLQWAEPSLLDLLEQIAEWVHGLPVLLLSMARPDLLDTRPGWGGGKPDATTFVLEPLPADETERLVETLFEGGRIEEAARARIASAAEGNPLFVEQLVEMLIDEEVIERAGDGTLVLSELGSIDVPPTIQALLAARLDRLSDAERRTIERASVVGKEFGQREVAELTPAVGRATVSTQLLALVRKELIRPERRRDDGGETYRFRHLLIRDAAYESLPKGERAELHERFADWLEQTAGERLAELDEIAGYHLERARAYRLELAPDDARTRALALRAGHRLAAAGRRAADRDEVATATGLLLRAGSLLVEDPRLRFDSLMAILHVGITEDVVRSLRVALEAEAVAMSSLDAGAVRRARLMALTARGSGDPSFSISSVRAEVEDAVRSFTAAGDVQGMLEAHAVRVLIELNSARWHASAAAAREGLAVAAAAGLERWRDDFAAWLANATLWGPDDATAGIATVESLLGSTDRRLTRSTMLSTVGTLRAVLNDRAAAHAALAEAAAIRAELGYAPSLFREAFAMYALDDLPQALDRTRREIALLAARGETGNRSTMHGSAALILARLDRDDEALMEAAESRALGQADDAVTQLLWRAAVGIVRARRGDLAEADQMTAQSIEIADGTDHLDAGVAWVARAEVLVAMGRRDEAIQAAGHARELYVHKGYVNAIRRVDDLGLG